MMPRTLWFTAVGAILVLSACGSREGRGPAPTGTGPPPVGAGPPAPRASGSPADLSIAPKEGRVEVWEETTALHYSFKIENRGDRTVTITKVVAGCSCNTTHLSAETVLPGGSATLGVVYSAAALYGELPRRNVTVYTDAAPEPLVCTVGGVRKRRFVVTPPARTSGKCCAGRRPR